MIVGIDVCHSGAFSYVGFAASYNATASKYFSLVRKQKKGQELIKDYLVECFTQALKFYRGRNKALPKQIILYRDGVGDSQRAQVMATEFPQLIKAIKSIELNYEPSIVIMIVNKRIAQRFFQKDGQSVINPPPGTIVDRELVEEEKDHFDFYLVAQQVNIASALPVHYFVSYCDSMVTQEQLKEFTYHQCYGYVNWAGPIKVPASCMYAHKIAYYAMKLEQEPNEKMCKTLHYL